MTGVLRLGLEGTVNDRGKGLAMTYRGLNS